MNGLRLAVLAAACALGLAAQAQSLWREDSWRPLIADIKAFRPGDVLTVQVFENSSAVTSANTGTHRANNLAAELSHGPTRVGQTSIATSGDFDGGGRTQRASRLLATVTVSVQEVLPGGQLRVGGSQSVMVNDELQKVTLEGIVRPTDISEGNVVQSTRIADARITYVGEGDVADRAQRPWWRWVLDTLGL